MKRTLSLFLALALMVSLGAFSSSKAFAEETDFGVFPAIAGENGTSYTNLFEVILSEEYDALWHDYIGAVVGEALADDMAAGLKGSISSEIYGEEAIAAFAEGGMAFDCWYINDAALFTFAGDSVTVTRTDGTQETHSYEYLGSGLIGEGETMEYMGTEFPVAMECDVYKSTDEAGEFNYFLLCPDTMDSTWHIEFRYGRDLDELGGYFVGPYAYWLAAGIDAEADAETIENVIALFCLENMDCSTHTEGALSQLSALGFVGTWTADLSAFGEEYAEVELVMSIDENGHGVTFMNGEQTADFEAFALDSGDKGDGKGLYVAFSNLEGDAEGAPYAMEMNEDGAAVVTFYSDEGAISWVRTAA